MRIVYFFSIFLLSFKSHAGEVRSLTPSAQDPIKFGLTVDLPEPARRSALEILKSAFQVISIGASEIGKIQSVSPLEASRALNPEMDVLVLVTTRGRAQKILATAGPGYSLGPNADAVTVVSADRPLGSYVTILFWDKIGFTEKDGELIERPDAFVRATVALGHELLGNVAFLKRTLKQQIDYLRWVHGSTPETRQAHQEIVAFSTGLRLIDEVLGKIGDLLPPKVIQDLREARVREEAGLTSWQRRLESLGASASKSGQVVEIHKSCKSILR